MKTTNPLLRGLPGFTLIWFGQLVSLLGTGMTRFALTIWTYQETGSATALALVAFFAFGPTVVFSPLAGALVDRWNRKLVMMLSDLAAGLSTVVLLLLYTTGNLEIWHLYVASAFASAFESFQFPAFSAAITLMVSKEHYGRVSGMQSLAESVSQIAAPVLAGILLLPIGIGGIMAIDVITFVFAVIMVLLVHIPQPATTSEGEVGRGSLWSESFFGFRYIWERPSLLGIQLVFLASNLLGTPAWVLLPPLILARSNQSSVTLGAVQSVLGVGGLLGGLVLSAWGGPQRKVHGVLGGMALSSLLGTLLLGLGREAVLWSIGAFASMFFMPLINGSNQAIWQAKVAPDVQGRVFATRRLIAQVSAPLAMLLSGPLADRLFEPAMQPGGALTPLFGWLVGVGPGAGMALLFVISGFLGIFVGVLGYTSPAVRQIEERLPDYTQA